MAGRFTVESLSQLAALNSAGRVVNDQAVKASSTPQSSH